MDMPKGKYTIQEAAEIWISAIQSPATKATQEQKDSLVSQIRLAMPKAKVMGVGYPDGTQSNVLFVDACNAIKQAIRESK